MFERSPRKLFNPSVKPLGWAVMQMKAKRDGTNQEQTRKMISNAALAIELFGEDELEKFANEVNILDRL